MKIFGRFICALLTAVMLVGAVSGSFVVNAANKDEPVETAEDKLKKYLTRKYSTPQEKLSTMQLKLEKDGYQLWVDELSGEVSCVDLASGQILSTNPYDIATTKGSESTKEQVMSQIVVRYVDNDQEKNFYSFKEASYRNQLKVKNIKGGVRVEYTIGREETRMLVPRMMKLDRYYEKLYDVMAEQFGKENYKTKKLDAYYTKKVPDECTSEREKNETYAAFPITKKFPIVIFAPDASEVEIRRVEALIKTYCPLYTYEELDKDHEETNYEGADRAPALFKMALEYMLDKDGLSVRLPANGIRFDESEYQLTYVSILPYMGAGANYAGSDKKKVQTGYTFYPDGSGSIFRFEDLANLGTTTISGKVYGHDFAYHTLTGAHQEPIRYPAFGLVANDRITERVRVEKDGKVEIVPVEKEISRGYAAVIEEGDALAEIFTYHAGALSKYNSMQMMFYPRPKDTYNMKDAISVGSNATWTVVSERKYVGSYRIRYFMLTDENIAKEKNISHYYEPSWLGMAVAYREYLDRNGVLKRLEADRLKKNIPLYLETFGTIETIKKVLSIPVNAHVALTSFDDVKKIYDELSADGIDNINFKLTGYYNGGMYHTMPKKLKWEKEAGGKKGFAELVRYADEKGFGVYPDFEFTYSRGDELLDGFSPKRDLARTIDDRFAARRMYSAVHQTFFNYFEMIISPAYYSRFYEKLSRNYLKSGCKNISLGHLGDEVSSDFDEDEPYNREDSKGFIKKALEYFDERYDNIMVDGGNAYTWKYVNHILNASLDSSRYNRSGNSVPFIGALLHGYIQFCGTPLNMEGNVGYAILRTIENGAAPYFILSYDTANTTLLKDDDYLNKYYSVRYDIWHDELIETYKKLNDVLSDVQTKLIVDHTFLVGERIPDPDEIEADIVAAEKALEDAIAKAESDAEKQAVKDVLTARHDARNAFISIGKLLESAEAACETAKNSVDAIRAALEKLPAAEAKVESTSALRDAAKEAWSEAIDKTKEARDAYNEALRSKDEAAITAAGAVKDAARLVEIEKKTAYDAAYSECKTATTEYNKVGEEYRDAINSAMKAYMTVDLSRLQAAELAEKSRTAADFVNGVDGAVQPIKDEANEYAEKTAAYAVMVEKTINDTVKYASVAIALNAENDVAAAVKTAKEAETSAISRAEDIKAPGTGKYDKILAAEKDYEDAKASEDEAFRVYEEAKTAYEQATEKAAKDTATEEDKKALVTAGGVMNEAKAAYEQAVKVTKAKEAYRNSSISFLKNSMTRLADERDNAAKAKENVEKAIADITAALANMEIIEGVTAGMKEKAQKIRADAEAEMPAMNTYVVSLNAIYDDCAEYVKKYVQPKPSTEDPSKPDEEKHDKKDEGYPYTKYTNDNGNIVKVVYGDVNDEGGYVPYKTIILNYNFFAVTVVVDDVKYSIPASGYVVFYD